MVNILNIIKLLLGRSFKYQLHEGSEGNAAAVVGMLNAKGRDTVVEGVGCSTVHVISTHT